MICINNTMLDPFFNIAAEEALVTLYPEETIYMLWQNPPSVVCGKNQNIYEEVELPLVWDAGVSVVRRNTGGGTVYHDLGNLNYTIITPRKNAPDGYPSFLCPMAAALSALGVPCVISGVCDLTAEGKKISGSAQAVIGGAILHHGTLLFDADLTALHRYTGDCSVRPIQSRAIRSRPAQVTNIKPYCVPEMTLADFRAYLWTALSDIPAPRCLNEAECTLAERLATEKYRSWEWTFGRSPAFSFEKKVSGIEIVYTARHGRITECTICGRSYPQLAGVPLYRSALQEALDTCGCHALHADDFLG